MLAQGQRSGPGSAVGAVFIATGAMVFNGARLGRAASVALGGAVHIGCAAPRQPFRIAGIRTARVRAGSPPPARPMG